MSDSFLFPTPFQTDSGRASTNFADAMSSEGQFLSSIIHSGRQESRLSLLIEPDDIPSQVIPCSPRSTEASGMSVSSIDYDNEPHSERFPSMPGNGDGVATTIPPRAGDPTQKLQERYDQEQARRRHGNRILQTLKPNYVCWSGGPQNQLIWNAVFVCPMSGECFETGTLLSAPCNVNLPLGWYGTKKLAIKAAAGRAEDCFHFRNNTDPFLPTPRYCTEEPYHQPSSDGSDNHSGVLDIPHSVPEEQKREIRILQNNSRGGALL